MAVESDSAAAWLSTLLAADHSRLIESLGMVERGEKDAIHQVRVACRRARSHVRTFAEPLDAPWAARVAKRLRRVAKACGDARDLEVLRGYTADHPPLDEMVAPREQDALSRAAAKISKPRTSKAAGALRSAADAARSLQTGPAAGVLEPLVDGTWAEFAETADGLSADSSDREWHQARVRAKQARYAAEAAAPVLGEKYADLAGQAKRAQTVLGEHQDLVMTADLLDDVDTQAAHALAESQRARRLQIRADFLARWHAA